MRGLKQKRVLVTGASSGIGQAIAIRFAEEGADVAVHFHTGRSGAETTVHRIQQLASPPRCCVVQADVSRESEVAAMFTTVFERLGGIDILINNAGYQIAAASHEMSVADFANVVATNLTGAFMCAQQAIRRMLAQEKPGVIINVSSVHEVIPKPMYVGYSVSKGGLQNLTRTLALEYARHGIRVNAIGPGATATPMNAAWTDDETKRAIVTSHIPLGRVGTSEEMAAAAAFLASDEAAYITGQTLFIDGGLTLYPEFGTTWAS